MSIAATQLSLARCVVFSGPLSQNRQELVRGNSTKSFHRFVAHHFFLSLSSSRILSNAGTEWGSDVWPKTKATSCLKTGEQISFDESRAEESASIAAGVPILRKVKRAGI